MIICEKGGGLSDLLYCGVDLCTNLCSFLNDLPNIITNEHRLIDSYKHTEPNSTPAFCRKKFLQINDNSFFKNIGKTNRCLTSHPIYARFVLHIVIRPTFIHKRVANGWLIDSIKFDCVCASQYELIPITQLIFDLETKSKRVLLVYHIKKFSHSFSLQSLVNDFILIWWK